MSIPQNYQNYSEKQPIIQEHIYTSNSRNNKKNLFFGFVGVGLLLFAGIYTISHTICNNNQSNFSSKHKNIVRHCNAIECLNFACDHSVNPFVCSKGGAYGGCSPVIEVWDDKSICEDSCTLEHCDKNHDVIYEEDLLRKCNDCNEDQCALLKEHYNQACSYENPYVCVADGENFLGCSNSKYHWEIMPDIKCSSCCDNRSCYYN